MVWVCRLCVCVVYGMCTPGYASACDGWYLIIAVFWERPVLSVDVSDVAVILVLVWWRGLTLAISNRRRSLMYTRFDVYQVPGSVLARERGWRIPSQAPCDFPSACGQIDSFSELSLN